MTAGSRGTVDDNCNCFGNRYMHSPRWVSNFARVSLVMQSDLNIFAKGDSSRAMCTVARSSVGCNGFSGSWDKRRSSSRTSGYSVSHSSSLISIGFPSSSARRLGINQTDSPDSPQPNLPIPTIERIPYTFAHLTFRRRPITSLHMQTEVLSDSNGGA